MTTTKISKKSEEKERKKRILKKKPHTGDKAYLDRCGLWVVSIYLVFSCHNKANLVPGLNKQIP